MKKIDDIYLVAIITYIFIISLGGVVLPSDLFINTPSADRFDETEVIQGYNESYANPGTVTGQISWFKKLIIVLFVPFVIPGIPLIFTLLLGFMNYTSAVIAGIYVFDKIRGI